VKADTSFLPVGRRIDLIISRMEMVSEGATGKPLDALRGGEASIGEWDDPALADDWQTLLERLVESMEIELGRAKGGRQYRPGNWRVDQKDERIRTIYPHRPARFVAWVEDVPELVVRQLRQEWQKEAA
jgi:hypothetical protein